MEKEEILNELLVNLRKGILKKWYPLVVDNDRFDFADLISAQVGDVLADQVLGLDLRRGIELDHRGCRILLCCPHGRRSEDGDGAGSGKKDRFGEFHHGFPHG